MDLKPQTQTLNKKKNKTKKHILRQKMNYSSSNLFIIYLQVVKNCKSNKTILGFRENLFQTLYGDN